MADPSHASPRRHGGHRLWSLFVLLSLPLGGCSFLADEFTWLDRAAPRALAPPDAPPSGLELRP